MTDIIVSSSGNIPNNHIHINTVYSLETMALGFLKDFKAGIGEIFGKDIGNVKGNLSKLRSRALEQLKENAKNEGATRIIGLRIEFSDVASPNGSGILVVSMYGDAIKPIEVPSTDRKSINRTRKLQRK